MKFGLQRIGAMLEQLNTENDQPAATAGSLAAPSGGISLPHPVTASFPQSPYPAERDRPAPPVPPEAIASPSSGISFTETVQPFPSQTTQSLALPKAKAVSVSSHRHATNPNLAMSLLKDIETTVVSWQLELEQVILQIQAVYADGPIVEGWLESQANEVQHRPVSAAGVATLRHAEVDRLMDYVEAICNPNQGSSSPMPPDLSSPNEDSPRTEHPRTEHSRTDYRLCGLDADGQLWSRPCPTQQVPYVSLAIARYQKLRILLGTKQTLENRLNQLIQSLTVLSSQIQKP
jgi:hypothetical protein